MRIFALALWVALHGFAAAAEEAVQSTDFDGDGGPLAAELGKISNAHIETRGGAGGTGSLRVDYVGYERGSRRLVKRLPLGESLREATLCYDVLFPKDFDFVKGGKLHGLGPAKPVTGGKPMRPDGWSARVMFKSGGGIATYIYHQRKRGQYGTGTTARGFRFGRDRYHAVSLHVRVNHPATAANGFVHLYVDGKLLARNDGLQLRAADGDGTAIEQFLFSTFHGGHTPSWAPVDRDGKFRTVHAFFDNFAVHRGEHVRRRAGGS